MNAWQQPPRMNGKQLHFRLASQHILQLHSHLPARKELLSRPMQDQRTMDPMQFFLDIKAHGLEVVTDLHVVHCINQQIPMMHDATTVIHHINVSAVTLVDRRFQELVENLLTGNNWKPEYLCWEITELEGSPNIPALVEICHWLIRMGFHVALDDYEPGNPYEPLLSYPLPWLVKLDKSLHEQPHILQRVIRMLQQRELQIVVEGIENLQQLHFCIDHKVDYVQGYYIERPQKLADHTPPIPPVNTPEPDGVQP